MMKIGRPRAFAYAAGFAVVLASVTLGAGGTVSPEHGRVINAWFNGSSALGWGSGEYAIFEGRFPSTIQELCASPYMPARCADLHIPPTNKDILSLTPDDPGYLGILQDNAIAYLLDQRPGDVARYRRQTLNGGAPDTRDTDVAKDLVGMYPVPADFGPSMIILRNDPFPDPKTNGVRIAASFVSTLPHSFFDASDRKRFEGMRARLSDQEKATYSAADWIRQTLLGYTEEKGRVPQTWDEVVQARLFYPFHLLRNEFNGGTARETATPSPGDFRIITTINTKNKVWVRYTTVIAYGAGGRVVFPAIDAPVPTPESEITIPPGQKVTDSY